MEAVSPKKAEAAADRLLPLMPAAGHIVHMPAHIYQRVGRYADAIKSNELAIAADEDYITQCRAQGLYPMGYYPHNLHFLWFAATSDGQSTIAIDAARKTASKVDRCDAEAAAAAGGVQGRAVLRAHALRTDGTRCWPNRRRRRATRFCRASTTTRAASRWLRKGRIAEAEQELAAVKTLLADKSLDAPLFSPNTGTQRALDRAGSARRRDRARAKAVRRRRSRTSSAPSGSRTGSSTPSRPSGTIRRGTRSGAALLAAGRPAEAETVYWEDLRRNPENGWALFGVVQALKAQKKTEQAAIVEAR